MSTFEADFSFMEPNWGTQQFEADSRDDVEYLVQNYVRDTFDGASDIEVTDIREIAL